MRGIREIRSRLSIFSVIPRRIDVKANYIRPISNWTFVPEQSFRSQFERRTLVPLPSLLHSSRFGKPITDASAVSRTGSKGIHGDCNGADVDDGEETDKDDHHEGQPDEEDKVLLRGVEAVVELLRECGNSRCKIKEKLDFCGVKPWDELVVEILSRIRHDWETAFTFFHWAGNQPGYTPSLRVYHSMISILAKMRKFDTAWSLIDEMRKRGTASGERLVSHQTLLIMIRRYCAVHDVGRAINTFHAHRRFKLETGVEDFHSLLSALCRYKNVQDAEHLMYCNRETYPLNTKSFNIILNGWGNVIGSPRESERVWREMGRRNIRFDAVSFSSMMSCYSKNGNLHRVLRLFNQMKKLGIEADRKVYNAMVHALGKARFVKEAMDMMKKMEEKGMAPNIVTYNSLIKPLCKARKIEEARKLFYEMLNRGLSPTIRTYHAFIRILRTGREIFEILEKMRRMGCEPSSDTYTMLIRKFCRWQEFDNVFRIWKEMDDHGVGHDRSSYIVLIHGLFLNGKSDEAYVYYAEMKAKGFDIEPSVDEMIQGWVSGKVAAENAAAGFKNIDQHQKPKKPDKEAHFLERPQTRKVVRERGFSLWDS